MPDFFLSSWRHQLYNVAAPNSVLSGNLIGLDNPAFKHTLHCAF